MAASKKPYRLKLEKSLTLTEAQDFYDSLSALTAKKFPSRIVIDGVENELIELPILQILAAVVLKARQAGAEVEWDNPSIALFESSMALGLDEALGV